MSNPDPKATYVVTEPHANAWGIFRLGDRVAGSNADVKANLDMFYVRDGLTIEEVATIKHKRNLEDPDSPLRHKK